MRHSHGRHGWHAFIVLAVALAASAACESPAADRPVAHVADWSLTRERLADLLVLAQPLPLDSTTATAIVEHWIGMAAVAMRAGAGTDLAGEAALDASVWLERREALLDAHRRAIYAADAEVTADRARREFEADTLRLLAHTLRRTTAATSGAERELQRRTARSILDDLIEGGSWPDAAARSEDDETRDASGLLGLLGLEELPPELRDPAAALQPGQVSDVVESPLGFHILYRPRFDDVPDLYARLLSERLLGQADARATERLRDSLDVRIDTAWLGMVRAMASGTAPPDPAARIATWEAGALPADVALKYVSALPSDDRTRMAAAADQALVDFIERLAVRQARFERARASGIEPDTGTLANLEAMHRADVDAWLASLSDATEPFGRAALARYMERLVARQVPLRPIPPLFRQWLLEPLDWSHDRLVQAHAVARARHLVQAASPASGS
ncbi:MAG TPA: peptidylprolyl isomerase [Longimicrobiales bacterium]|nr:peptidylprolyl isomerase [Longimicrobiales bacterium]